MVGFEQLDEADAAELHAMVAEHRAAHRFAGGRALLHEWDARSAARS